MTELAVHDATSLASTVRLAADGDEAAFTRLVAEHRGSMLRVAYVVCGDPEVAADAVQSAWAIAWRRLGTLQDPARVRPWLASIAANEAKQLMRRQRRRPVLDLSNAMDVDAGGNPADGIALVDLQRALAHLTPEERRLIALRYVAGLDSTEIGLATGLSASGVRGRIARLLDRLRTEIDHG